MKLEKLNHKQELKLPFYREKWLNKLFNYELYNSITNEEVILRIKELYKFCNLEEPIILFVDSPLACQYAANFIKVSAQVSEYNYFSSYINSTDFGWLSFYDFFSNETNIISSELKKKFNSIIYFSESSFMSIQLEKCCIISKYPSFISRNNINQLHNINDSAIKFDDGYCQHYFNGIFIQPDLFQRLISKEYTFEDFTNEENEEIKSLVLAFYEEKFGGEFVFRFISDYLNETDTYIDKKSEKYLKNTTKGMNLGIYTLFKGNINNIEIAYVRCYCPSTDRMFFLGVNPNNNNAKDAISSLCQVPVKLKNHILSINRQGEMFSFNFDEIGTQLLKSNILTKEDFNNTISLTGNEYFSKIKFEY